MAMTGLFLLSSLLAARSLEEGLALVRDGRPVASIVLPARPTEGETRAAEAVRKYIRKMSGANLPIVRGSSAAPKGRAAVLIGRAAPEAAKRAGRLKRNGFVLSVDGRAARIAGRDDLGTVFGAYRFLELLGCRFYAPGELGEVVPKKTNVLAPKVEAVEEPDFEVRGAAPLPSDWALENRLNVGVPELDGRPNLERWGRFERWRFCRSHPAGEPTCPANRNLPRSLAERLGREEGRLLICDRLLEPGWDGLPWPVVRRLARDLKVYKKLGAPGVLLEAGDDWLGLGTFRYWAAAKLLWNADSDLDSLLDDFLSNFYGPKAGRAMRALLDRLEGAFEEAGCLKGEAWEEAIKVFTPEAVEFCERCLEEAERSARGVCAKRVALARAGFDYLCLYLDMLEQREQLVGPWVPFVGRQAAFYRLERLVDELRSLLKAHLGDHSLWSGALLGPLRTEVPRKVEALRPYSLPTCDLGEQEIEAEGRKAVVHRMALNSGLLPYVLEYRAEGGPFGPGAFFARPEGGLALVGPTRANFGPKGAIEVVVNGLPITPYRPAFQEHPRGRFVSLVWRTGAVFVRLAFREPPDLSALLISARVWSRGALGPTVVVLRARPCGLGPSDGRRVVTTLRSVGTTSGGEVPVLSLDTNREFWALLYDADLEAVGRSEGPCGFAFRLGRPASVVVEVGREAIVARLTYPVGTERFGLILWEFPGLNHEEALRRLKAELKPAMEDLEGFL